VPLQFLTLSCAVSRITDSRPVPPSGEVGQDARARRFGESGAR
jgi:hypothetical protein